MLPMVGTAHPTPLISVENHFVRQSMTRRCALTLIELLVVIAIVAVLIGLLRDEMGQVDGIEHRTSYLVNSLLSHKTRRYGRWNLTRFVAEVGTSNFVCFSERNAAAFTPGQDGDPRQDDYDIWLGTKTIK